MDTQLDGHDAEVNGDHDVTPKQDGACAAQCATIGQPTIGEVTIPDAPIDQTTIDEVTTTPISDKPGDSGHKTEAQTTGLLPPGYRPDLTNSTIIAVT